MGRKKVLMVIGFLLLFVFACFHFVPVAALRGRRVAFLPWGSGKGQVGLYKGSDGRRFGPPDFLVTGATVYVVDLFNQRLVRVGPRSREWVSTPIPQGTDFMAPGPGAPYLASDQTGTVSVGDRVVYRFPHVPDAVLRTSELAALGKSAFLLLYVYGLSGQTRSLVVVGPQGARAIPGDVQSVAPSPQGGFYWSDGHRIFTPSGSLLGQSPGEIVGASGGQVALLLFPGTRLQSLRFVPNNRQVALADPEWATLGLTARLLPSGLLAVARAEPKGYEVFLYRLVSTVSLQFQPLWFFQGG